MTALGWWKNFVRWVFRGCKGQKPVTKMHHVDETLRTAIFDLTEKLK